MTAQKRNAVAAPGGLSKSRIVEEARSWIGTPYQHQASARGAGCDCLGLIRGLCRTFYGRELEAPPPYTPDWAESAGRETLLEGARRHFREKPIEACVEGDLLLFRVIRDGPAKHAGVSSGQHKFIHAYAGRSVCESYLTPWWEKRLSFVFEFPSVDAAAADENNEGAAS